jgi:bifunctional DNase/RNase
VLIYNLVEGIFFAKLVVSLNGKSAEIDARTSDAVAIAVRFNCPVYCYEFILDQAGVNAEDTESDMELDEPDIDLEEVETHDDAANMSVDDLQRQLDQALEKEDYEKASRIRDEINKRRGA